MQAVPSTNFGGSKADSYFHKHFPEIARGQSTQRNDLELAFAAILDTTLKTNQNLVC